jgi:hypothetical protein
MIFSQFSHATGMVASKYILLTSRNVANHSVFSFDNTYCDGTGDNPQPKTGDSSIGAKVFKVESDGKSQTVKVSDWINGIQAGRDILAEADGKVDKQIGALGDKMERVYQGTREVPLFEFRDLGTSLASKMADDVDTAEQEIIKYHNTYKDAPKNKKRAVLRPRQSGAACAISSGASTGGSTGVPKTTGITTGPSTMLTTTKPPAPTISCYLQNEDPDQGINGRGCICGSTTLPLLTVSNAKDPDASCAYTALPSSSQSDPIPAKPTKTWTDNCQACTLVGGIADDATCTSIKGCTPTATATPNPSQVVWLSNNSISIGDADDANGGADLRSKLYKALHDKCPDNANECDTTSAAEIDEIPTVVGDGEEYIKLKFTFSDSHYDDTKTRDRMLAAAVSSWERATSKSCSKVEYIEDADPTASGCGQGPVKRNVTQKRDGLDLDWKLSGVTYSKRAPICENCDPPVEKCHYSGTICSGPNHISVVWGGNGNPYENHMNIGVAEELDGSSAWNEFICDLIIDGITALAMEVAPELAGAELFEGIEFESLCQDALNGST